MIEYCKNYINRPQRMREIKVNLSFSLGDFRVASGEENRLVREDISECQYVTQS
jgi:hypothetical protein